MLKPADTRLPEDVPQDDPGAYPRRVERLREQLVAHGLTHVLVYGDREHSANLHYLSGFDPRFEEALLLLDAAGTVTLLVGNEGKPYASGMAPSARVVNVREFSLPGQPWHDAVPLVRALAELELGDARVGVVGWKHFEDGPPDRFDAPAYVIDALRSGGVTLRNVTALLSEAPGGLRTTNSANEIAQSEFAARLSTACVSRGVAAVRPGARELDVAAAIAPPALPLSIHPIITSGPRVSLGIASASDRRIEHGDPVMIALGFRGALTARAGMLLTAEEAESGVGADYLARLAVPYFEGLAAWYGRVGIGVTGGELHAAVCDALDGRFELALNPGHLIHLEEWVDSPLRPDSPVALSSGMVLQCDMIPVPPVSGTVINAEDTVALADAELRDELARDYPELWQRVALRRETIESTMGLTLAEELLPLSDLAGLVAPFIASPEQILTRHNGQVKLARLP
jgi:hypothetical protein